MNNYVAFLRGINVGKIKIKMDDLEIVFEDMELINVKTFLSTGNVSFDSDLRSEDLKLLIEDKLSSVFSYKAYILLYTLKDLKDIIGNMPFKDSLEDYHRYVVFICNEEILREIILEVEVSNLVVDKVVAGDKVIYWQVPKGMTTESIVGKIFTKISYKKYSTTRNINTLEKIIS